MIGLVGPADSVALAVDVAQASGLAGRVVARAYDRVKDNQYELLLKRKSVRHYTDKPVTRETIMDLLKAAMAAPSAKNRQPWVFIAITEKSTLVSLSEVLTFGKMIERANAAIAVCADLSKTKEEDGDRWKLDCSAASQNVLLAAEALGLGAVWVGVYPDNERISNVKPLLNLPEHIIPLNIIPVGYPAREEAPKDKLKEENIRWERWG